VNYGSTSQVAQYRKMGGLIYTCGRIKDGTLTANAFVFPSAYAPPAALQFPSACGTGAGEFGKIDITAAGDVTINAATNTAVGLQFVFAPSDPSPVPNPVFPLTLEHGLKPGRSPKTVLLADAIDVTTAAHVSSSCSWKSYDATQIQIIDLPDLFATRTYDLTFLVLGGDP
jgi:hypothetical protein